MKTDRNIVLVVIDALRYDRVGASVGGRSLTPHIDALAERGTVFNRAYACSNATDPSITSINTGRYPRETVYHHGPFVTDLEQRRVEEVPVLPELLNENGLTTIASGRPLGRWHSRGFDRYPDISFQNRLVRIIKHWRSANLAPESIIAGISKGMELLTGFSLGTENPDDYDPAIRTFFKQLSDQRFYGFVHLMDTHTPYEPDQDLVDNFIDEYQQAGSVRSFLEKHADNPYISEYVSEWAETQDAGRQLASMYASYDGAVIEADRKVGELVAGLKDRGLFEDTSIIVTSDHGESLGEHGIFFDHHGLYEPTIHVPLIVRTPDNTVSEVNELVELIDLMPTLLDLAGVEKKPATGGQTLCPLLYGEDGWSEKDAIFTEEAHAQRRSAVRTDKWKYITLKPDEQLDKHLSDPLACRYCDTVHGETEELYNLSTDDDEQKNVITDYETETKSLRSQIKTFETELSPPSSSGDEVTYEDEEAVMDRLEDLGYR